MTIQLGQEVRDRVTGFTGIATARIEYINGCIQYSVKPRMKEDGTLVEAQWFDDALLEVIGSGIAIVADGDGGPIPDLPSSSYRG